jgi:hypothetical protein
MNISNKVNVIYEYIVNFYKMRSKLELHIKIIVSA